MDYTANNWATHFRQACICSEDKIAKRALILCQSSTKLYKAWAAIYRRHHWDVPDLHDILMASYLGLRAVVKLFIKTGKDVNSKDQSGRKPPSWAAGSGPGCQGL